MTVVDAPIRFDAPGPGEWMLDRTHHGRRPLTAFLATHYGPVFEDGMEEFFARMGLPLARPRLALVEGCTYFRIMGVGEPESPSGRQPPAFVFKVLSRVHPELRRRTRTAAETFATKRWRADVDRWYDHDRHRLVERLRSLQGADLRVLDDESLTDHFAALERLFAAEARNGFVFHSDLLCAGDLLAHAERWGIDPGEASGLLRGSSPATLEVERTLAPVAAAVADAGHAPASVAEIRALGPAVAAAVDEWLAEHGWRLLNSDDLDSATLAERPDLQLAALLATTTVARETPPPSTDHLRARVPADERERFDELVTEARYGMRLRDDHVGVRWNWPMGLIRRALLEVGRRLEQRGGVEDEQHAVELAPDEVRPLLVDGRGPDAGELAARRARRDAVEAAGPPSGFGAPAPPPPLDAMPAPIARAARAAMAIIGAMEGDDQTEGDDHSRESGLAGVGIGEGSVEGRARVASTALDALERVEPGDILVAPYTSPSYNSLFPIVGGVVTDEGGPMSHTAIMVREFGVPGVVGVRDATSTIPDGARIRVDAADGTVEVLA